MSNCAGRHGRGRSGDGPAGKVDPAADVVGAVRDDAGSIAVVRDGAIVIGAVDPLESAGGGSGSDMIETWSLITKLVGTCTLPGLGRKR